MKQKGIQYKSLKESWFLRLSIYLASGSIQLSNHFIEENYYMIIALAS